jgi:hypothetical protein
MPSGLLIREFCLKLKTGTRIILKNGFFIPIVAVVLYSQTQHPYLTSTIILKLYPANYFFWYYEDHDCKFQNPRWNQLKQFVRFTDTGHYANAIYLLMGKSPRFFPIAFNIHFAITFGYWIARAGFGMNDFITKDPEYSKAGEDFWASLVHGWPLLLLLGDLRNTDMCLNYGTRQDLVWSYVWILGWFLAIYLPWRLRTGDPVYSIMSDKVPIVKRVMIGGFMISLITVSNAILWYTR